MDAKTAALVDAAFHAWVTLGELLTDWDGVPREEIEMAYAALTEALRAFPPPPRRAPAQE